MRFKQSRSRVGMVTVANCRMAALRTQEQGAARCRNLTPGGHLNLARTGHVYLALIHPVRIRCAASKGSPRAVRGLRQRNPRTFGWHWNRGAGHHRTTGARRYQESW